MDVNKLAKRIADGAIQHGEDSGEAEHTIGDLEDALRLALHFVPDAELPEIQAIMHGGVPLGA